MNIFPNKSLIREIAPGVIQVGNNPFAPSLSLNELQKRVEFVGEKVLLEEDFQHISGVSLTYDDAFFYQQANCR